MSVLIVLRSRVSLAFLALGLALILAAACNGDDGGGGETPVADEEPEVGGGDSAEIQMLPGSTFDTDELIIGADVDVKITADNTNGFHSFAIYNNEDDAVGGEESIAETETCSAPCVDSVSVNLAAGEYFFRCEVHPTTMTGTLIVQ